MQTSSFLEIVNRKYTGYLSAALARRQVKATDETFHVLVKGEWASLRLGYTTISPIFTRLDRQSRLGGRPYCALKALPVEGRCTRRLRECAFAEA